MSVTTGATAHPARADRQATILEPFTCDGRGLHTGKRCRVTVSPGAPDGGIVFVRLRPGADPERIPALWIHAVRRPLCTALALNGGRALLTVEHLLAALSGFGIDNAVVTVEGDELPIFDGSASAWCAALAKAGRQAQPGARRYLKVLEPVEVRQDHRLLRVEPSDALSLDVNIDLSGFGPLNWTGRVSAATLAAELAPARSFGRLKWALPLKLYSLVKREPVLRGAHFGSTAVLWGGRVLGGMRVPDEPVRHRALDLLGDLALAGLPLLAHVTAHHVGHTINGALVAELMGRRSAWEVVTGSGQLTAE